MSLYRISGVWKDANNVITHYAFHTVSNNGTTRAEKKTKAAAIALLDNKTNTAKTWIWNYNKPGWVIGEDVEVVNGSTGKYLRSNRDNKLTDNLGHLINFNWIAS